MADRASEQYHGERYLRSWNKLLNLGDGTIKTACELWLAATYYYSGTTSFQHWQSTWWMLRNYQSPLSLSDPEEPAKQALPKYIAAAYRDASKRLVEGREARIYQAAEAYMDIQEAIDSGAAPPPPGPPK